MRTRMMLGIAVLLASCSGAAFAGSQTIACLEKHALTEETASGFARIALHCVHREFPNKPPGGASPGFLRML